MTGQQVDRVGVAVLFRDRARLAQARQVGLDALGEQLDVLEIARRLLRVLGQPRGLRDVAGGAVRLGAERDRALGEGVVVVGEADREGLEQRVQRRRTAGP